MFYHLCHSYTEAGKTQMCLYVSHFAHVLFPEISFQKGVVTQ